jgi:signal transduction histidine kinase
MAIDKTTLETNKDAFTRILDNLLSNAGKYNIANGNVNIVLQGSTLTIQDTGKALNTLRKCLTDIIKNKTEV